MMDWLIQEIRYVEGQIRVIQSQPQYNDGYNNTLSLNCLLVHHAGMNYVTETEDDTDEEGNSYMSAQR